MPGVSRLAAGNRHDYLKPMRPGQEFHVYDKYMGFEEKKVEGKPYRMFIESVPRYFVNQFDETISIATGRNIYLATPPSKRKPKRDGGLYKDKKRQRFSQEQLDEIHREFDDQLAGKWRRGAKVRYWEDVVEGEEIRPLPRVSTTCATLAPARWSAATRMRSPSSGPRCATTSTTTRRIPRPASIASAATGITRTMQPASSARPMPTSAASTNEMMLVHLVTDWMGDDGFVKSMDSQDRRMNFLGDATWVKGRVARKYIEDGERLVDLDVWGENQDGVAHTTSRVTVKLIAKGE